MAGSMRGRSMRGFSPHGFSLLEALVAMAVLTLGLFGAAALQSVMVRAQRDAAQHVAAASLGAEMADLLMAYPAAERWIGSMPAIGDAPDCFQASCTADAMAAFVLAHWRWRAGEVLPGVRAELAGACCAGPRQLVLTWRAAEGDVPPRILSLPVDTPA